MISVKTAFKIAMLVVTGILAASCSALHPSGCHKTTALGGCGSGTWDDQDEWGAQARAIRNVINANIPDPQKWKGKYCRVHLEFKQDGTVTRVRTSEGNRAYCEALKSAVRNATFPAFNNPAVYHDFEKSRFEMKG